MKRKKPEIEIPYLTKSLQTHAAKLEQQKIDMELVRAQFADHFRDVDIAPIAPDEFAEITNKLDDNDWRRFALAVIGFTILEDEKADILETNPKQQLQTLVKLATETTKPLTMLLLRQSILRIEEFSRHFVASLEARVCGESVKESQQRLKRLDYKRLLKEAEGAKKSAEERMEYLKKLQEEQEQQLAPRGKW